MVLVTVLRNVALAGVSMGVHVPEDTEFAAPVSTYLTPDIQSSFFQGLLHFSSIELWAIIFGKLHLLSIKWK